MLKPLFFELLLICIISIIGDIPVIEVIGNKCISVRNLLVNNQKYLIFFPCPLQFLLLFLNVYAYVW